MSAALDRFAPVALQELISRAALQTRVDRKYLLPAEALEPLLRALHDDELGRDTLVLDDDGRRWFAYESEYFDTPQLDGYLAAARSRRRRFKIRTRTYLDAGACYLEVKTRGARSLTVKDRLDYRPEQRREMTLEGRSYADAVLEDAGIERMRDAAFEPVIETAYDRATLLLPDGGRATIDRALRWRLDAGGVLETGAHVIVETKSASAPSMLDRMLWRRGHRPDGISKYGVGLAALRPELPSNKWRRIVRRLAA